MKNQRCRVETQEEQKEVEKDSMFFFNLWENLSRPIYLTPATMPQIIFLPHFDTRLQ